MVKLSEIDSVAAFAWSHDALPLIATGTLSGVMDDSFSSDSFLEVYDPFQKDANNTKLFSAKAPAKFASLAWSDPSESHSRGLLAGGLENSTIELWDAAKTLQSKDKLESLATYKKHTSPVLQVKFNPLQKHILGSSGSQGEIFVWDTNKGTAFSPGRAISPAGKVSSLSWNNSVSHIFASAGDNGYASIWDLKAKREVLQLTFSGCSLSVVEWHPSQSTKLVTASGSDLEPVILTWDLRNSSTPEKILKGHRKAILSLDWCKQDPTLLLSSGKDDATMLWNPIEGVRLGEYPSLPNWVHQANFAPKLPEVIASASLDKKIVVQTLQDTSPPVSTQVGAKDDNEFWNQISSKDTQQPVFQVQQAPAWLGAPSSAQFGFGGRIAVVEKDPATGKSVVKVLNAIPPDMAVDAAIGQIVDAFQTSDFTKVCEEKLKDAKPTAKKDWEALSKLLQKGKSALLEEKAQITKKLIDKAAEIDTDLNADSIPNGEPGSADDDFFAQLGSAKKADDVSHYSPEGAFDIASSGKKEDDVSDDITKKLLSGDFEQAMDMCIADGRVAEALVLALNGNQEMKDKAKSAFFARNANDSSLDRILYSASKNDISDIVANADIKSWKDIAKAITAYCEGKPSYDEKMSQLGDRLLKSDSPDARDDAIACYFAGGALGKVASVWLTELESIEDEYLKQLKTDEKADTSASDIRFKALSEVVEKIFAYQSGVKDVASSDDMEALGSALKEYAEYLANTGHFDLAYEALQKVPDTVPGVKLEKQRLAKALGKSAARVPSQQQQRQQQPISAFSTGPAAGATGKYGSIASNRYPAPQTSTIVPPVASIPGLAAPSMAAPTANASHPHSNLSKYPATPFSQPATTNGYGGNFSNGSGSVSGASIPRVKSPRNPYAQLGSAVSATEQPAAIANPYAPRRTALDSLKQPSQTGSTGAGAAMPSIPPPPKVEAKSVHPTKFNKDEGGWNDLPEALAPPKKASIAPSPYSIQSTGSTDQLQQLQQQQQQAQGLYPRPPSRTPSQPMSIPPPPQRTSSSATQSPVQPVHQRKRSSTVNPYAPTAPEPSPDLANIPTPQGAKFQTPQPPAGMSPKIAPRNPYAPSPSSQPSAGSFSAPLPRQPSFVQTPPQPLSSQMGGFQQGAPPPPPVTHAQQFNNSMPPPPPPMKAKAAAPPTTSPPPLEQPQATQPPSVATTAAAAVASGATGATGDRSQIPAAAKPIYDNLSGELEKVKPKIPAKFSRQLTDAEKRLNILFDKLETNQLSEPLVESLVQLSNSLAQGDFATASSLQGMISANHAEECGDWMVGVKRLIGMDKATSS